ncbi:integrin alpha-7-like [Anneissia japonica]|uniref:integrin alpha-7-like n=1 Tax=Anneissia japonica TaxID=1529436 RepID=UPI001425A1AD|nr:integrin alpha-7-like [Anneissia japonica]
MRLAIDTAQRLLVGAPIYDGHKVENVTKPGEVFRCPYTTLSEDCVSLNLDNTGNSPLENKTDQWLGVNVRSEGPEGRVVVCAHRYRIAQPGGGIKWGLGKCYIINQNVYDLSFVESRDPKGKEWIPCYTEQMDLDWYGYCQAGTGLGLNTIDSMLPTGGDLEVLIGAPGSVYFTGTTFKITSLEEGNFPEIIRSSYTDSKVADTTASYSGFSISVGKLNAQVAGRDAEFVVSGAPRWNGTGGVLVLKYDVNSNYLKIHQGLLGVSLTESFGYETVVIDINGDGFDDIVVGAPMHYDRKDLIGGRIYIFLNSGSDETYFGKAAYGKYDQIINGPLDSMFGLALANLGDMNGDKAQELVVGAPFENKGEGAVYIYMGREEGKIGKPIQKITPQTLNTDLKGVQLPNMTFGYSLSAGMDMDENEFPDLLIGAFESDSVILVRSRPIIKPEFEIITKPENLTAQSLDCPVQGIDKQCITIKIDITYYCAALYEDILTLNLILEADVTRLENDLPPRVAFKKTKEDGQPSYMLTTNVEIHQQESYVSTGEYILVFEKPPTDIYSSVVIRVSVSLPEVNATMPEPGEDVPSVNPFPILDPNAAATKLAVINFTKRCDQDDGKCETDLRVNASLELPKGSDGIPVFTHGIHSSIKLKLNVENLGEDAYDAKVMIEVSDVLMFDGDSSSLCEQDPENPSRAVCKLGNPFEERDQKMTTITLTKGEINANQGFLDFNITATTTTNETKPADNSLFLTARVESLTDLILDAIPDKPQYEVGGQVRGECAMENLEMIGSLVQQNWTIHNDGPGIVPQMLVTISFPYETLSGKWLLYLTEKPILSGGSSSYCVLPDNSVDVLNLTYPRGKDENGQVKTCFPRSRRNRREVEAFPTPQAQSKEKIKLDCKSNTANCFLIKCYFNQVQNGDTCRIVINSRLWNSTFLEDYIDQQDIDVIVRGGVEISNGSYIKQIDTKNDYYPLTINVVRDFSSVITPPPIKWWIILLAVIGGLLVLILIVLCLWKVGFFERHGNSPCGFFERKTMNYQYATVEQKSSGRKGKKDKTYMADDVHYTGVGGYE